MGLPPSSNTIFCLREEQVAYISNPCSFPNWRRAVPTPPPTTGNAATVSPVLQVYDLDALSPILSTTPTMSQPMHKGDRLNNDSG